MKYPFNGEPVSVTVITSTDNAVDKLADNVGVILYDGLATNADSFYAQVLKSSGELMILLNDQKDIELDITLSQLPKKIFDHFKLVYRTNEDINEKFQKLNSTATHQEHVIFRSGIANDGETAYISSGNNGGISLANVNSENNVHILSACINSVNAFHTKLFVDNGLIRLLNQGNSCSRLDTNWVFEQFDYITSLVNKNSRNQLYFVIPDDIHDHDAAKSIIANHRSRIMRLLDLGVNVIIPIHGPEYSPQDIAEHALDCAEILERHKNLVLGVPCLKKPKKGSSPAILLRLPIDSIEAIFKLGVFRKCHFLGLSDRSGRHMPQMMMLSRLYQVETSLDASRTVAIFSNNGAGKRVADEIDSHYKYHKSLITVSDQEVRESQFYQDFSYEREKDDEHFSGMVTQRYYDLINTDIRAFWSIWNAVMPFELQFNDDDVDQTEAELMAWQMVGCNKSMDRIFFNNLKDHVLENFKPYCIKTGLKTAEKRCRAITELFSVDSVGYQFDLLE